MTITMSNPLTRHLFSVVRKHAPNILLFFFSLGFCTIASAQTVQGTVADESGKAIPAASVIVKGTSRGTVADANGAFTIQASSGETLLVTSVGFADKEIKVGSETSFSITLAPNNSQLEQVIVVGYGAQRRTAVTGAISSVNNKTLNEIPVVNVQQALQGRVPGLNVVNNGSPGSSPIVTIRGISSISYASNPLYVVDGFPTGDLSTIDTRDIESVDVLKDASTAAIYGSRATSGVIMITTKKGRRDGKLSVNLNSYYGIQNVTQRLDLLNPEQFDQYAKAYRGSLVPRRNPDYESAPGVKPNYPGQPLYDGATSTYGNNVTDWQDEYFRQGYMTQTNIGVGGGNEVSRFYASGGFLNQDGTTPTTAYRRYNFRINSDHVISKTFTFGENIYIAYGKQNYDNNEAGARSNLLNVIRMMPYMPVYDPTTNGGYRGVNSVLDGGDPTNPIEDAELKNPGTRTTSKILGTVFGEVNFTPWLKFRSTFGVDYASTLDYRFSPIFNDGGTVAGSSAIQATITNNRSVSTVQLYTEQLTFDKTFGDHHVKADAIYEYQGQRLKNENASGNQASNNLKTLNNATNVSVQTLVQDLNIVSYIGRLGYDFQNKYFLNAALRYDGGSYWAPGNKWQSFPSASVGWRIDQEDFMKNMKKISELKLRAGYGITGLNGAVLGQTPWLATVSSNSAYYPFGNSFNAGPASSINSLGNQDLEWETTKQLNIGLDLGLLNNAITLTAEYYQRKTDNLILRVPLPPSLGFINSSVPTNVGNMENSGLEFQIGYNDRKGDFTWNALANLSFVTNKVIGLAEGVTNIEAGSDADFTGGYNPTNTAPGDAIQSFYGWVVEGIFQTQEEVDKHAVQVKPADPNAPRTSPGDLKFKDVNGDGVITTADRVFLGSFIPKVNYSLNLGGNYKNFGLTVFLGGVQGNKIYNATRTATEGMIRFFNAGTQVLNAWTPDNTNTNIPRAVSGDPNQNARPSTRFIEDGSYLRLRNVMLSYNVPAASLQSITKGTVKGFNIYVSAQNLFTITDYSGFDPEVGNRTVNTSSLTNGVDYAVYPQAKGYQIGVNVNF